MCFKIGLNGYDNFFQHKECLIFGRVTTNNVLMGHITYSNNIAKRGLESWTGDTFSYGAVHDVYDREFRTTSVCRSCLKITDVDIIRCSNA